ncbi:MAG: hypothetical protein V4563_15440 [Pseudomonadota bacterium]
MSKINPQPKKLTLDEALAATSKPLKRWGDLISVEIFEQLRNNCYRGSFPNGEVRSTFMPSRPDRDGNFERNFPQPDTNNSLSELYEEGGWLESVAEFSDEALALHYEYRGGIFRDNSFAGDVGNPSRFISDCKESLEQINQPTHNDVQVILKSVLTVHKKDRLAAVEGKKFSAGRKINTCGVIRKAITKLLKADPTLKNPSLWSAIASNPPRGWTAYDNHAGKYLEGPKAGQNMDYKGRFCTVCGEERKKITG